VEFTRRAHAAQHTLPHIRRRDRHPESLPEKD
jgi:hypothetical protein